MVQQVTFRGDELLAQAGARCQLLSHTRAGDHLDTPSILHLAVACCSRVNKGGLLFRSTGRRRRQPGLGAPRAQPLPRPPARLVLQHRQL